MKIDKGEQIPYSLFDRALKGLLSFDTDLNPITK
jgi:hypothetical protein